jgi:hypothetical protein
VIVVLLGLVTRNPNKLLNKDKKQLALGYVSPAEFERIGALPVSTFYG